MKVQIGKRVSFISLGFTSRQIRRRDSYVTGLFITSLVYRKLLFKNTNLNGVDIVGDDHEFSLLFLNKGGDCVDTMADNGTLLGGSVLLAGSAILGPLAKPCLLGLLGLRPVLVHKLEQLSG